MTLSSLLRGAQGEKGLWSLFGRWARAVSSAVDQLVVEFNSLTDPYPWGDAVPAFHLIGDSITLGNDNIGGYRNALYQSLRNWRSDFEFIGSQNAIPTTISQFGDWYHDAVGGYKIQDISSHYATWMTAIVPAFGQTPDVVVDLIGTNNIIAGDGAATMLGLRENMDAIVDARAPNAERIVLGVLPFVAGTTTGANLAAWNATRASYNILLQSYCATKDYQFISLDEFGAGDISADGVHPNQQGYGAIGKKLAEYLDKNVLGRRRGVALPSLFKQTDPYQSVYLPTVAAKLTTASHPGFQPNSSIAVALDYFPMNVVSNGTSYEIISFGTFGNQNYWALLQRNAGINVAWVATNSPIFTQASATQIVRKNTWHRLMLIGQSNGSDSALGLYVNGELVGLRTGLAAFNMAIASTIIGVASLGSGTVGFVGRVYAWKGSGIPRPGSMAALRAAEADYYRSASFEPSLGSASFPLNANLNDQISGNPAFTLAGGALQVAACPTGTPRRPWEVAFLLADGNRGEAILNGASPSVIAVSHTDIRANDVVRLTLKTLGGTGTGLMPTVTVAAGSGFTLTGPNGDTSTWLWEIPLPRSPEL